MKYEPKKVYIKENAQYKEISNEEHTYRKSVDVDYRERKFIPIQGCIIEVDEDIYKEFYRDIERMKYLKKMDIKFGLLSIDYFDNDDDNGVDFCKITMLM